MKKKMLILFITGCLLFACSACQKLPESPIVVGKVDKQLEKTITKEKIAEQHEYTMPDVWNEEIQQDELTVTIEADVEIPNVLEFPAAVLSNDEITQEQADRIMDVLLQGATLYDQRPDGPYTKEEVSAEILRLKQSLTDPNSDLDSVFSEGTPEYEAAVEVKNEEIAGWEAYYNEAPDEVEKILFLRMG